jgi:glutathione reductase (NADPH)
MHNQPTTNHHSQEVGVKLGPKGQVVVDEFCRTSVPSIFAVGDVIDRIQLTPVALMEGMAVAKTVALGQPSVPDYTAVPSAVFCNPEMATVVGGWGRLRARGCRAAGLCGLP